MTVTVGVPVVSVEDLAAVQQAGGEVVVLDVREPWEWSLCRMTNSISVPLASLPNALGQVPTDRDLVVVCHHGVRSALAVKWLRGQGYDRAVNLDGGIDAWARRIDPKMRRY